MIGSDRVESGCNGAPPSMVLHNEFATVTLSVDSDANGPRLKIVDQRSGQVGFLDPLELESLVWARRNQLEALLDPGATRWTGPVDLRLDEF
ncbi:hypothetical protein [Actinophytocola sp.]|uniref:hypothetical protein n=1 Tax=Actinophytocola sp. TaxID=1872138 RepID=UPI003D6B40C7